MALQFLSAMQGAHTSSISWPVCALALAMVLSLSPDARAQKQIRVAAAHNTVGASKPVVPARNPTFVKQSVRGQMQIVISIPDQRMDVYDGTVRVASSRVSTGKRGYDTPQGVFSVIQKNRRHYSNLYGGAPMPFMQRLTWSGIALHAGYVPRYPASHGCIRLPRGFAKKLFGMTSRNVPIIVNRDRQKPSVIVHDTLFQPRPRRPVSVAADIRRITLDGLSVHELSGRDAMVLNAIKADRFAAALRAAYHPNTGAGLRAHVRLTQRLLGFLGYGIKRPDGDLGPITRRAISRFQRSEGLKRTGRPSKATTLRLYSAVGHKMITMTFSEANAMLTPPTVNKPLRILITRAVARDGIKRAQQMLDELGYYVGGVDGALGRNTRAAIREFQRKSGLKDSGAVNNELLQALVDATGGPAEENKNGRIFVRQGHRDIYESPVSIADIDTPLGTHVFTSTDYGPDRTGEVSWIALTVAEKERRVAQKSSSKTRLPFRVNDARSALARIKIPEDVRAYVEERLMPGSSLIISDNGSSHETGEGTDFIVLTR